MFKEQDLVYIKEEKNPIIYIIIKLINQTCYLKGLNYRIYRITTMDKIEYIYDELKQKETETCNIYYKNIKRNIKERVSNKILYGRILHIDGDPEYLDNCLNLYKEMKIPAEGIYIEEKEMKNVIKQYILEVTPDIVVITGHDSYNGKNKKDLKNYENSQYFIDTIREIRKLFNIDSLPIIVGACCSHFEALIAAGANFASSPSRINIHTYDPAVIAIKLATTSCNRTIDFENTLKYIENKRDAFGGIETKGKMRILL